MYKQVLFVRLCEHGNGFSGCYLRLLFVFVPLQISCEIEVLNIEITGKVNLSFVQRNTKTSGRTQTNFYKVENIVMCVKRRIECTGILNY